MPGIGFGELAIIFLLLLIFVGPQRLPQVARSVGKLMVEVRRATDELKGALYMEEGRLERERRMNRHYGQAPTPPPPLRAAPDADSEGDTDTEPKE